MNFKLYLYIPVVLYLAMFSSAWGDVYYVRPAGSTYGASSGLSYEDAFAGLSAINERIGSGVFVAGDTIYLCDTFTNEYLSLELLAGAPENLITIRGDYAGHPGRISTNLNYAIRLNNTSYERLYSL
jgi:hypothetical protein